MLPATIQDAVTLTRKLKFRYLWIDALCIVQDEFVEKIKEIAKMDAIYASATLTISASRASHVHEGFLHPYPNTLSPGFRFRFRDPGGKVSKVVLQTKEESHHRSSFWTLNASGPTHSRAWTMQEHILSTRLVSYGSMSIGWDCQSASYRSTINLAALRPDLSTYRMEIMARSAPVNCTCLLLQKRVTAGGV